MSDRTVDWRDRSNWIRNPADYADYPPPSVRSGMKWSYVGIAHLNNWHKFFAGLRERPPEKSGLFRPVDKNGNPCFGPADRAVRKTKISSLRGGEGPLHER